MRKSLPCLLLWFTMCGLLAASSVWAAEPVGNVESVVGTVQVVREGRTLPAKAGDPVYLLDKWQTKAQSSAEIVFADKSRVKLSAGTVLEITEYVYNPQEQKRESLFSMLVGKARFLVQDLQGYKEKRFRVQTQTAIVGTRDTDFVVGVVPEPPVGGICREPFVEAYCVENAIMMASRNQPDKPVILTSNMISQACGFEVPTPPRFATPAERARMTKGVERIGSKTEIGPARPKAAASEKGEDKSGSGTTVGTGTGDSGGLGPGGGDRGEPGGLGPLGGSTTTTVDTTTTTTMDTTTTTTLGTTTSTTTTSTTTTTTTRPTTTTTRPTTTTTAPTTTTTAPTTTTTTTTAPTTTTTAPTTTTTTAPTTTTTTAPTTTTTLPPPPPPPPTTTTTAPTTTTSTTTTTLAPPPPPPPLGAPGKRPRSVY